MTPHPSRRGWQWRQRRAPLSPGRGKSGCARAHAQAGVRLFVDEGGSMLRCGAYQGRDADHRSGGPRYLLPAAMRGITALRALRPSDEERRSRHPPTPFVASDGHFSDYPTEH